MIKEGEIFIFYYGQEIIKKKYSLYMYLTQIFIHNRYLIAQPEAHQSEPGRNLPLKVIIPTPQKCMPSFAVTHICYIALILVRAAEQIKNPVFYIIKHAHNINPQLNIKKNIYAHYMELRISHSFIESQ